MVLKVLTKYSPQDYGICIKLTSVKTSFSPAIFVYVDEPSLTLYLQPSYEVPFEVYLTTYLKHSDKSMYHLLIHRTQPFTQRVYLHMLLRTDNNFYHKQY